MKPIQRKDLVIGEVYADKPEQEGVTKLRYVGRSENTNGYAFEFVSGEDKYFRRSDGYIGFSNDVHTPFYQEYQL